MPISEEYKQLAEELSNGTEFKLSAESQVLTQRRKVRTPLIAINCLLGGGIPFGTVLQSYGLPKSAKSTLLYIMMGLFQKDYPEGISLIIDTEASADGYRLTSLGVDLNKVLRITPSSIEAGFLSILKVLKNKESNPKLKEVPVFIIWDTISKGLAQDESTQSRLNAMDRARIIKNYMSPVMNKVATQDIFLGLINQVIVSTDRYGNSHYESGGGVSLKHDVHMSLYMKILSDSVENGFLKYRYSDISIEKSKVSPEVSNIRATIDVTKGGTIDEVRSFVDYLIALEAISMSKGWYRFNNIIKECEDKKRIYTDTFKTYEKSYRYEDLLDCVANCEEVMLALQLYYMDFIRDNFSLQKLVIEEYYQKKLDKYKNSYIIKSEEKDNSEEVKDETVS